MQKKGNVVICIAVVTLLTLLVIPIYSYKLLVTSVDMTFLDVLKDFGGANTDGKIFLIIGILGLLTLVGAIVTLFIEQEDLFPIVLIVGGHYC